MSKDFKSAIALIFRQDGRVLVLKRSLTKETFPGAWSLPSTYVYEGETREETANRLVKRKLGLASVILEEKPLGVSPVVDRGDYDFVMSDYEVKNFVGEICFDSAEYTEMKFVTIPELVELIQNDNDGVMGECTKTFLTSID